MDLMPTPSTLPTAIAWKDGHVTLSLLLVVSSQLSVTVAQESEVQAEYDSVLREAKLLRLDLQHALTKCLEHKVSLDAESRE